MRAAALVLLALVIILLLNIVGIFVSPAYKQMMQGFVGTGSHSLVSQPVLNTADSADLRDLNTTLDRLTVGLDALSGTGTAIMQVASGSTASLSWVTISQPIKTEVVKPTPPPEPPVYPLSIPLQAKLMPDVSVKKVENRGIFDIKIFSNLGYTTYRDDKNKMNIYAFADSYPVLLTNLKLASNVYAVKETDTFFEASFFLNPSNKRDTTIRFVTSIGGKAYGFEVSKIFYTRIKKLLTSK